MARGRKIASPESRKRAQTAARESRQRLENKFREDTREKFFKGREDVSDDRLDRRRQQDLAEQRFIRTRMKPVGNTGGTLLQKRDPLGMSLEDFRMQNAMKYGPTLREIGGDIRYGLGNIFQALAEKGTPLMQLGKAGLEGIQNLLFPKPTVVNYGGSSDITVTEQPMFPYNFETIIKPKPEPLLPNNTLGNIFLPTQGYDTRGYLPEGFSNVGIENPLFRSVSYEPIRVSDMDMTGVTAQEGDRPVLPENVIPMMRVGEPMNIDQYKTPVLPPEVTDPRMYQGQTLYAQNFGLPSLKQSYDFLRNPQVETPLGNLRFDNVLSGNPQLGYGNTVMINGVPVDLNATIGNQGLSVGGSFSFKKGGSVDKYAGLGYKLK